MSRCRYVGAVVAGCLLTTAGGALAETVYVPDTYATIQEAMVAVNDGDEIAVGPGTYNELVDFMGKAVRLYSTNGPEVTIIDGTGLESSVVSCVNEEGPDTILEGFTITGGRSNRGGGLYSDNGRPTILDCVFRDNVATLFGGGVFTRGPSTISACSFVNNRAVEEFFDDGAGGAVWSSAVGLTLIECLFEGNASNYGGAIRNSGGELLVERCIFRENAVSGEPDGNIGGYGGAIHSTLGDCTVEHSAFVGNSATIIGGGIIFSGRTLTLNGCSFTRNAAERGGGGGVYAWAGADLQIINSVWTNDTAPSGSEIYLRTYDGPSSAVISYSDVHGGMEVVYVDPDSTLTWGPGNIEIDPLCDADGRPQIGSPCIDAGDNNAVPEGIPFDLEGNHRFVNDPCLPDTGNPDGVNHPVDMGAYEYQPPCPADLNCNEEIEFGDLLPILSAWNCAGPCVEDLDGSGVVDFADVLVVLSEWGQPCLCERCGPADDCDQAPTGGDGFYAFSNRNTTTDGPELPPGCDEGNGLLFRNDVWMKYMALCDGTVMASVCDSDFDTRLAVYEYSEDECPGAFLACSDDACGENGTRSEVSFPVESGETYLIRIGARFAVGEGTLVIDCTE